MANNSIHRPILSISELTTQIKTLLEKEFSLIWVTGEISNFKIPASKHFYFTLKDAKAQINAVMFRAQNRNLKFVPEDGMSITGLGRISVYEQRGVYQIIFEYLEPAGAGALQFAFEQLKARLLSEGLFDDKHKKSLPFLPNKISIVTSPTGAVVHDIIKILGRRFANLPIEIVPVKVQGDGSEKEIVSALELLNIRKNTDVIILARGGGSLEDLHAFNSEDVARAIFASTIPLISAVGHETDFSIADFVADLRAPTPSAAAELVVPLKRDLVGRCSELSMFLSSRVFKYLEQYHFRIKELTRRLGDPQKRIDDLRLRIDDLNARIARSFTYSVAQKRERLMWRLDKLHTKSPLIQVKKNKVKLEQIHNNMFIYYNINKSNKLSSLRELAAKLHALSPLAILHRGYSITRTIPEGSVIRDPNAVSIGQELEVRVAKGLIFCSVKGK
ncbi:MAG: exodeoxyribonuclease VII large subunit [Proteobacteria bacterium]|nr:exodeoxyribonuclease VII large subunit [Pseudomonadota bacterium]